MDEVVHYKREQTFISLIKELNDSLISLTNSLGVDLNGPYESSKVRCILCGGKISWTENYCDEKCPAHGARKVSMMVMSKMDKLVETGE